MKKRLVKNLLVLCILTLGLQNSYGQIALWTYEPAQVGGINTPTPNSGVNSLAGSSAVINGSGGTITPMLRTGMTGTGCGDQVTGTNAWAFEPFGYGSVTESNGAQFKVSTAGFENIYFTWDQRWSNTAPNTLRLKYTLNGSTWVDFVMTSANTTFCTGTLTATGRFETNSAGDKFRRISANFSGIAGAANNPLFAVRILAATYQSTGQFRQVVDATLTANLAGTWRFDNVTFSGTLIPGPNPSVISGTTSICAGSSTSISVAMTGGLSPFRLVYTDGTTNFTVNNYVSGTAISVTPSATKTYTIVSVYNLNNVNYGLGTGNSGSAVITVNPLPPVTAAAISACDAGPTALTTGTPAGGTYSIPNPYSGPNTTFTYTYTDPSTNCSKTTSAYSFTRNTPVTFGTQPATTNQTTCQGSPFSPITVSASGTGPLSYQWYSNSTQTTTGGTPLVTAAHIANGSKTASFTPLATSVGTFYYYVIVTNTCGFVKSGNASGLFTVNAPSVSGTISPAQTICSGSEASNIALTGQTGSVLKWQRADDLGFSANVQDIFSTATTLTGADIGPISVTTYIRAVIKNGVCAAITTSPIQLLVKSTTWNGSWSNGIPDSATTAIFESDYSSPGNLSACVVLVSAGNVVFNSGDILTIQNNLTINGGTMTFDDSASLIQLTDAVNSGFVSYKRNTTPIKKYDYTYWSSPVDFQILASLSPLTLSDKYYWWNPAIYNWATIVAPGISAMEVGKGYIIRGPQNFDDLTPAIYPGTFFGTPNNGDYTVPITVAGANDLNLLGNPYPSALNADLFMADADNAASLGIGTTLYFWTHNTPITSFQYSFSDYATYNYLGGTGTGPAAGGPNTSIPTGKIAAGQAFFIKGVASGSAKFKNSMRVGSNNNQFFRTAQQEKSRFWLELSNDQNAFKQLMIGYADGATNGFDTAYDAPIANGTNPVQLYSILDENKLTIQGRGFPFEPTQVIPLGFSVNTAGTFNITLSQWDGIFESQPVFMKDNLTGGLYDLQASAYTFDTWAGTIENRFEIHFQADVLAANDPISAGEAVVYQDRDELFVHSSDETIQNVTLFDMTGRKIVERKNEGKRSTISIHRDFARQPWIVRIVFENGLIQNRKMVF